MLEVVTLEYLFEKLFIGVSPIWNGIAVERIVGDGRCSYCTCVACFCFLSFFRQVVDEDSGGIYYWCEDTDETTAVGDPPPKVWAQVLDCVTTRQLLDD